MRYLPLTFLAATACHPAPRAPAPEAPRAARMSPGTVQYAITEHRHVEQRYQDQPIVADATTFLLLSVALTESDSGLGVDVVIDSVAMTGDAVPSAALVQAATGSRLTGATLVPGGRLTMTPSASTNPVLDQITLGLQELLPRLPPDGAGPGSRWTDSTTYTGRSAGLPIAVTARSAFAAGSWSDLDAERVLEVTGDVDYTLAGEGERLGQWMVMRGTGTSWSRQLLTADGAIVVGVRVDSLHVDVEVEATGIVIPVVQTQVDTVRRVLP